MKHFKCVMRSAKCVMVEGALLGDGDGSADAMFHVKHGSGRDIVSSFRSVEMTGRGRSKYFLIPRA